MNQLCSAVSNSDDETLNFFEDPDKEKCTVFMIQL